MFASSTSYQRPTSFTEVGTAARVVVEVVVVPTPVVVGTRSTTVLTVSPAPANSQVYIADNGQLLFGYTYIIMMAAT